MLQRLYGYQQAVSVTLTVTAVSGQKVLPSLLSVAVVRAEWQ